MKTNKDRFYGAKEVILGITLTAVFVLAIIVAALVHPFSEKCSKRLFDKTLKKLEPYREYLTGPKNE